MISVVRTLESPIKAHDAASGSLLTTSSITLRQISIGKPMPPLLVRRVPAFCRAILTLIGSLGILVKEVCLWGLRAVCGELYCSAIFSGVSKEGELYGYILKAA